MASNTLKTPKIAIDRAGYKFVISFGNIDQKAKKIHIETIIYEKMDKKKKQADKYVATISASNSSYVFKKFDKDKYYPYRKNYDERIKKIVFNVYVENGSAKSKTVTKEYKFDKSVKPTVAISYAEDGTNLAYALDINDDYSIYDDTKKVCTRARMKIEKDIRGDGKGWKTVLAEAWYDRDKVASIRKQIKASISTDTPVKYRISAYGAGPGGKSDWVQKTHVIGRPRTPKAPTVTRLYDTKGSTWAGLYDIKWSIDTDSGWRPVDTVTIQYIDLDTYLSNYIDNDEDMGSWSTAKSNIHSSIKKIETDEIGYVPNDKVRYFRIQAVHDGNIVNGARTRADYGRPSDVTNLTANVVDTYDKNNNVIKNIELSWTAPATQLLNSDTQIKIYLNSNTKLVKTITYGDADWPKNTIPGSGKMSWVYSNVLESDIDKFRFKVVVHVGGASDKSKSKSGLANPSAESDGVWTNDSLTIPEQCYNLKAKRLSDTDTTVELTWINPTNTDTLENGVEVAWSNYRYAWESNTAPTTNTFENGALEKAYIVGLTEGETYYFWVRPYYESADGIVYGLWSDVCTDENDSTGIFLYEDPDIPILSTSRTWVKEGGVLQAQWLFSTSGTLPQNGATICIAKATIVEDTEESTTETTEENLEWNILESVIGEEDHCTLDFNKLVNNEYLYPAGNYKLKVRCSNDAGETVDSETVDLMIAAIPTCTLTSSSLEDTTLTAITESVDADTGEVVETTETYSATVLKALPLTVTVGGSSDNLIYNLYIYCAQNFDWQHPDNDDTVFGGDCIWTSEVSVGTTIIESARLADNSLYRLSLTATDPDTGIISEEQYIDFEVHWEHQAMTPINSTVSILDYRDTDGGTFAILTPVKPDGALDTDVCDIYRCTADKRQLCASGVSWGSTVIDAFPTFGDIYLPAYCFCTRTSEGAESWYDVSYKLTGSGVIINFGNQEVKLPFNVSINDSRSKQGTIRSHLGGTKIHYAQPQIESKQSITSDIVKVDDEDTIELLYELSRFTDICYVRTSTGMGFPATVDVSLNTQYNNKIVSVSISATEVDANGEYMAELA